MATKQEYAHWCVQLMEGDTHFIAELRDALIDDRFIDEESQEWALDEYGNVTEEDEEDY